MKAFTKGQMLLAGAFVALAGIAGAMIAQPSARAERAKDAISPASASFMEGGAQAATTVQPQSAPQADPVASDDPFVIKRILPIEGPIKYGEWHWNEDDVPAGPIVITVDLDARVLSIFRAGYEIGAAAVLLGTEDKPTPTGVFPITQKARHHVSNLYDAEMPYMQRLTNDGITLHATNVEWGYASHGCIGMPEAFAAKVFASTRIGDRVFITRGKMVKSGDSLIES